MIGAWAAGIAGAGPASSPARQCADAAAGSEVEVCLQIAVERPEAVDEVAAALIAHVDRAEAPDRALLDALLLLSSERAIEGARILGELDDPRAIPVLFHMAGTARAPAEAEAAIAALAGHPAAVPELAEWLVDRAHPLPVRLAVARALGEARRPDAADALIDTMRRRRLPQPLKSEIARALAANYPDRAPPERVPTSTDGTPWLVGAGSYGLAYPMATAGQFGQPELWPVYGLTGGVSGAAVGWLWGQAWPLEAGDAATIATLGAGGIVSGVLIGTGVSRDRERRTDIALLYGFGGEFVGFGAAYALERVAHRHVTALDAIEASLFAGSLAGGAEAFGAFEQANGRDSPRALITGVSLAAGLGVGQAFAPRFEAQGSLGWIVTGAGLGLVGGLMVPLGDDERSLLPIATAAGGTAIGVGLTGVLEPPGDVFFGGATGAVLGGGLGLGSGLLFAPDTPDVARGIGLAGLLGGYAVGAVVARADPDPIDDRDVAVAMAAGGWAAFDAIALAEALGAERSQSVGAVLFATALAASTASALNLAVDVPVPHTLSATSIGLWGGYAGAAIGEIAGVDPFAVALPASNVALLGGMVLVSPLVGAPPLVIGIADAGGVLGASLATLPAALATDDSDVVRVASMGGATVGLVAGAIVGERWRTGTRWTRRDVAIAQPAHALPALRLPRLHRRGPPPVVGLSPLAVAGAGGGAVVSVTRW